MSGTIEAVPAGADRRCAALAMHARGFALLPIGARSKTPNTRVMRCVHGQTKWSALARRPATRQQVVDWFDADPATGVGVITGEPSGLVVRDYDNGLPPVDSLPKTPVVTSPGRGGHVYLRIARPVKTRKLPDGELRGDGGYVVAPPSLHPNGGAYSWLVGLSEPLAAYDPDDPVVGYTSTSTTCNQVAPRHTYRGALVQESVGGKTKPLVDWCKDPEWVERAAKVMGVEVGRGFRCVMPGHRDTRPSANLWCDPDGVHVYRCHHPNGPGAILLPDLYATIVSRRWRERNAPEIARWMRRLLHETGELELPLLEARSPRGLSDDVQRALAGFVLLIRVRWAVSDFDPAPFSRRFGAEWCAMPERRFEAAKGELIRRNVMVKAGEIESRFEHPTSTYVLAAVGC